MNEILVILTILSILGMLACYFAALARVFMHAGALRGVLGLLFPPYVFVWGWLNGDRLRLERLMWAWTVLIIALFTIGALRGGLSATQTILPPGG